MSDISSLFRRAWARCAHYPTFFFVCALFVELLACVLIASRGHLQVPIPQFMLGAQEIRASHHINSTFLPVGYAALLGWMEILGGERGIIVLQAGFLLAIVALSRACLKLSTSSRFATVAALLIGLYPVLLMNVHRVNDADLTLLLLLALVLALERLQLRPSLRNALLAGCALGGAVLVRPNLMLMVLLLLWPLRRVSGLRRWVLAGSAVALAGLVYVGFTTAVHGRPFFPQNGPYNLFGGYNSHTAWSLRENLNVEDSILPALADHGYHAGLDWSKQSDQPGVDDSRDERYRSFYSRTAREFIRAHPGTAMELSVLRLGVFLGQHYVHHRERGLVVYILAVSAKSVLLLVVPVWIGLLVISRVKKMELGSTLIIWLAVLYTLPFVLINSDPRFRIPLEGILLMDIARMLYKLRSWKLAAAHSSTPTGFASSHVQDARPLDPSLRRIHDLS